MGYKSTEEWFKQAEYDIGTADAMLLSHRFIYAVFMTHLAVEKPSKGLWAKKYHEDAPKTHNLIYLYNKISLKLPDELKELIDELDQVSVPTRYPEELDALIKDFPEGKNP